MSETPRRLWDKGAVLDALVQRFTVGDDPYWDLELVAADCLGSAAHARTLAQAGLLSEAELRSVLRELRAIRAARAAEQFEIPRELEDVHTAIEAQLTRACGPAGEKIHTGRSRNDQVATALRIALRRRALDLLQQLEQFVAVCGERAGRDADAVMPGYTHMQPAMPSSFSLWLGGWIEAAIDAFRAGLQWLERCDACPLGSGAGFGVPLPLDRALTARLLGFARVQRNPIDVQNSRGRIELGFVRFASDIGAFLEKLAGDALLFCTAEFGFFRLPAELTTGSSIMPQKRNPDLLELLRAGAARLRARSYEIEAVVGKLPSSYHRDLQLTKAPTLRAGREIVELLEVGTFVIARLQIDRQRMQAAMRDELFATHAALERVQQGQPFRQAYRAVASEIAAGSFSVAARELAQQDDVSKLSELLAAAETELAELRAQRDQFAQRIDSAEQALLSA